MSSCLFPRRAHELWIEYKFGPVIVVWACDCGEFYIYLCWDWRASCVGGKCYLSGGAWSWMCWLKLHGERYSRHYQLHEASSCPHSACDWYIVLAALKTVYYADWLLVTDIKKPMYDWYIDWYICYKTELLSPWQRLHTCKVIVFLFVILRSIL